MCLHFVVQTLAERKNVDEKWNIKEQLDLKYNNIPSIQEYQFKTIVMEQYHREYLRNGFHQDNQQKPLENKYETITSPPYETKQLEKKTNRQKSGKKINRFFLRHSGICFDLQICDVPRRIYHLFCLMKLHCFVSIWSNSDQLLDNEECQLLSVLSLFFCLNFVLTLVECSESWVRSLWLISFSVLCKQNFKKKFSKSIV